MFSFFQRIKFLLCLFIISLCAMQTARAAATLGSADLVVVGMNLDDPDNFLLLALADIPANSVIFITDHGQLGAAEVNDFDGSTSSLENIAKWVTPSSIIEAGTLISFFPEAPAISSVGTLSVIDFSGNLVGWSLSLAGDSLTIYQTANNAIDGTIQRLASGGGIEAGAIYVFNNNLDTLPGSLNGFSIGSNDLDIGTADSSGSATGLIVYNGTNPIIANGYGISNFHGFEVDNWVLKSPASALTTKAGWLDFIHRSDATSWESSNDVAKNLTPGSGDGIAIVSKVTVTPPGASTEPTEYPTNFVAHIDSVDQITTEWREVTGSVPTEAYLVLCSTTASFSTPIDSTPVANDNNCADGSGAQNISIGSSGTRTATWAGLVENTQYFFKIFPYTGSGASIDYKTDGTPPTVNGTSNNYFIVIEHKADGAENNIGTPTDVQFTINVIPTNVSGRAITGSIGYTGAASNGTDYVTGATRFSIANNAGSTTLVLAVIEDTLVEATETVRAQLSNPSTGLISTASATANLSSDDSYAISIIKNIDGAENNSGSPTDARFTISVTPTNASGGAITGSIAYTGTASNGTDYATGATSFSIANNTASTTLDLAVTEDTLVEEPETLIATISSPSTGTIESASATASLSSDDSYAISIVKNIDGAENNSGSPTDARFTISVTPTNASGGAITGSIAYTGTASNGTDYATGATSFSIANNTASTTLDLVVTEDTLVEESETLIATISSPSTGAIESASATASLSSDDSYVISINKTNDGAETESGAANDASFTISVSPENATGTAITGQIDYSGTATNGVDYASAASTFSIADKSSSTELNLAVINDSLVEETETAIATLSNPSEGSLGIASATAYIVNVGDYVISIHKTTDGAENNAGATTPAVFTLKVTPSNASGSAITGTLAYSGTALNESDYSAAASSFSIENNSSETTLTLTINEDNLVEETESIIVTASKPSLGSMGSTSATAELSSDDSYSISIAQGREGAENNRGETIAATFIISVTPENISGAAITGHVTYTGSALENDDYVPISSFSIEDNSSNATLTLVVLEDRLVEESESIIATLSELSTGNLTNTSATTLVFDDDEQSTYGGTAYRTFDNTTIEEDDAFSNSIFIRKVEVISELAEFTDSVIRPDALVSGGIFAAEINSSGEMKDVKLRSDVDLAGGKLSGVIQGLLDPEHPTDKASIRYVELVEGVSLENIVLGSNIIYPESGILYLGAGVKITELEKVPANIELKNLFSVEYIDAEGKPQTALDLQQTISPEQSESLLQKINRIPALANSKRKVTQNPLSYLMELKQHEHSFILARTISILRLGHAEGIIEASQDNEDKQNEPPADQGFAFNLNTYDGLTVTVIPVVFDANGLMTFLGLPEEQLHQYDNSNISIEIDPINTAIIRPQWVMNPADDEPLTLGVFQQEEGRYPLYYQVFEDELGMRWEQVFYPSVADMQGLQTFAAEIILNEQGELSFSFANNRYKGMLGYWVIQKQATGELSITMTDDLDGDGLNDFEISYPSGQVQLLFAIN
ncbi:MAG: hypothetical protein GQ582_01505 [Methyloprofundus sp.]|nr:hypothetical protein [Methyloprofundus sp.]